MFGEQVFVVITGPGLQRLTASGGSLLDPRRPVLIESDTAGVSIGSALGRWCPLVALDQATLAGQCSASIFEVKVFGALWRTRSGPT